MNDKLKLILFSVALGAQFAVLHLLLDNLWKLLSVIYGL
jgi:hypothetical protein